MTSTTVSAASIANWKSLTQQEQFAAVAWAAHALRRRRASRELGAGVRALGHGKRERRRGEGIEIVQEPVLAVYVRKKWAEGNRARKKAKAGSVPTWLDVRAPIGGKRRKIAIPTDVCETHGPGIPHTADELVRTLRVHDGNQDYLLRGTACALVRDNPVGLSLLTCRHVAYPSMMLAGFSSDQDRSTTARTREAGRQDVDLGSQKRSARFQPGSIAFDAALLRVPTDAEQEVRRLGYWNTFPTAWAASELTVREAATPAIHTKSADHIRVEFVKVGLDEEMGYRQPGTVGITEVCLMKILDINGIQPGPGDSGAPVFSGATLLGMYIGIRRDLVTAIVIPSYQLFRTAFAPPIELVV